MTTIISTFINLWSFLKDYKAWGAAGLSLGSVGGLILTANALYTQKAVADSEDRMLKALNGHVSIATLEFNNTKAEMVNMRTDFRQFVDISSQNTLEQWRQIGLDVRKFKNMRYKTEPPQHADK